MSSAPTINASPPRPAGRNDPAATPKPAATAPATSTPAPTSTRRRPNPAASALALCSAASGATDEARRAGSCAATNVAITPAAKPIASALAFTVRPPAGSAKPKLSNIPLSSPATAEPADGADRGRGRADEQSLDGDGPSHLPARRTDRAEQRELAGPLRDRDRERVVDAQRRDDERDPGEHDEERPQHVEELARDVVDHLVGELRRR